jgi:hypothetical protein
VVFDLSTAEIAVFEVAEDDKGIRYVASKAARAYNLTELVTCNDIEVTWLCCYVQKNEGVANSIARGRGSCDTVRWPWHSNTFFTLNLLIKEVFKLFCPSFFFSLLVYKINLTL